MKGDKDPWPAPWSMLLTGSITGLGDEAPLGVKCNPLCSGRFRLELCPCSAKVQALNNEAYLGQHVRGALHFEADATSSGRVQEFRDRRSFMNHPWLAQARGIQNDAVHNPSITVIRSGWLQGDFYI